MNIEKSLRSGLPVLVLSLLIGGQFEVYMMNVDGSDVMRLTFSTAQHSGQPGLETGTIGG
jgi:Tol biopolymer transport system component